MARPRDTLLLTVVRCGETDWDREKRIVGAADLPLSAASRATVAGLRLPAFCRGTIHHPPDEAASDTASLLGKSHGLKTRANDDLTDPHLGLLEGLSATDFAERYPKRHKQWQDDPLSLSPPEGENLAEARARILAAVARILRRSRTGEVVIVLHALGLGFLRCWLGDRAARELWQALERPARVERYALTLEMVRWLEEAATTVPSRA